MKVIIKKADVEDYFNISKIHAIVWKNAYINLLPDEYLKNIRLDDWIYAFE